MIRKWSANKREDYTIDIKMNGTTAEEINKNIYMHLFSGMAACRLSLSIKITSSLKLQHIVWK